MGESASEMDCLVVSIYRSRISMPLDVTLRLLGVEGRRGEVVLSGVEEVVGSEVGVDDEANAIRDIGIAGIRRERGGIRERQEPGLEDLVEIVGIPGSRSGHEENGEEIRLLREEIDKGGIDGSLW